MSPHKLEVWSQHRCQGWGHSETFGSGSICCAIVSGLMTCDWTTCTRQVGGQCRRITQIAQEVPKLQCAFACRHLATAIATEPLQVRCETENQVEDLSGKMAAPPSPARDCEAIASAVALT